MTTNFDNWKAGLTVEDLIVDEICQMLCVVCPANSICNRKANCLVTFKAWAESECIPPKAKPQFKVGDKVMLREGLEVGVEYGELTLLESMAEYAGKVGTISTITHDGCHLMDEWGYAWSAEMLQPAPTEKTKIQQLADLLGVEVGAPFNVVGSARNPHTLAPEGHIADTNGAIRMYLIGDILTGEATIEKIPQQPKEWKPKYGDDFWLVTATGFIVLDRWLGVTAQLANYAFGNRFPTEEAAKAGKADILAKFEAIRREIGE